MAQIAPVRSYGARPMGDVITGLPLAAWWKRFLAGVADFFILGIGNVLLSFIHLTSASRALFTLLMGLCYYGALAGSRRGQTVGMEFLGIAVRRSHDGAPLGFWRAAWRQFVACLMAALVLPFVLDCLAPLWDKRRRAWHDHLSSAIVVDIIER